MLHNKCNDQFMPDPYQAKNNNNNNNKIIVWLQNRSQGPNQNKQRPKYGGPRKRMKP